VTINGKYRMEGSYLDKFAVLVAQSVHSPEFTTEWTGRTLVVHIDAPVVVHHCFQLLSSSTLGQDGQATLHQWRMHLGIAKIFFSLEVLKCIAPLVGRIWDMFLMMDPNQQDLDTVSTVFACGTIRN